MILVFRLDDKLGDSVTATGFLRELKHAHPEDELIVVAGPTSAALYKNLSFIDRVITAKKGLLSTLRLYHDLRGDSYKYVINTSHILSPRVIFLCSQLKAQHKLSFQNNDFKLFSKHVEFNLDSDHVTSRYKNTLAAMQIASPRIGYEIQLPDKHLAHARESIARIKPVRHQLIVLNSFAGARLRNLNQQTTFALVRGLLEKSDVLILSIGNPGDLQILSSWIKEFNDPRWVYIPDGGDLYFNCAIVAQADLVITPDTAWVHIASAFKRKLVAIYREDTSNEKNKLIWAPYFTDFRVVEAPFTDASPNDINTVPVPLVITNAFELLEKSL